MNLSGSLRTTMPEWRDGSKRRGLPKSRSRVTRHLRSERQTTDLDQFVIAGRRQSFFDHCGDGMACCSQNLRTPIAEILVELDLQADASRGTST